MTRTDPMPPWWARPATVAVFVLVLSIVKLAVAGSTELVRDESYYALWSVFPGPGYLDHPPMVAWAIWLGRALAGDGEMAVRLGAIAAAIGIAAAQYQIAAGVFRSASIAALSVYFYSLSVASVALLTVVTPDPFSTLFWTLAVWAMVRLVISDNANWWLAAGVFAGLGLLSKYSVAFLAPGLLVWLLANRPRWRWFATWQVWAGAVLAVLIFSPVIIYNFQHDFEGLAFQGQRVVNTQGFGENVAANLGVFVLGEAAIYLPGLFIATLIGAVRQMRQPRSERCRGATLLTLTSLPMLAYFLVHSLHSKVAGNWTMPIWPGLAVVGAWALFVLWTDGGWRRRVAVLLGALQIFIGFGVATFVFVQAVYQPLSLGDLDRTREMHGWRQLTNEVNALAKIHHAGWIAVSSNYGLTGYLSYYGRLSHSGIPVRDIKNPARYRFLPPLADEVIANPAILVNEFRDGGGEMNPGQDFAIVTPLGMLQRRVKGETEAMFAVYLVSDPKQVSQRR